MRVSVWVRVYVLCAVCDRVSWYCPEDLCAVLPAAVPLPPLELPVQFDMSRTDTHTHTHTLYSPLTHSLTHQLQVRNRPSLVASLTWLPAFLSPARQTAPLAGEHSQEHISRQHTPHRLSALLLALWRD